MNKPLVSVQQLKLHAMATTTGAATATTTNANASSESANAVGIRTTQPKPSSTFQRKDKQQQHRQTTEIAEQQRDLLQIRGKMRDGEPIKLPDNLESLPRADSFPSQRHRWNTNEEIAAILINFEKHSEWQSKEVRTRPKSGSLLLYSRKKVRYRRDGYCWKKRKDGKTTREDHMKLKVQGTECIYGCYVHSAILPTFHRRCYWLLQNPDIVLVHYLNVPYPDDNKMAVIAPSITLWGDKKEWTKDELVSQLKPMLSTITNEDDLESGNDIEISTTETVESIVGQLMEKQRASRQAALVKQLDCGCDDPNCVDGQSCARPIRRNAGPMLKLMSSEKRLGESYATNATPNVVIGSKLYNRWTERQRGVVANNMDNHHAQHNLHNNQLSTRQQQYQQQQQQQQLPPESAIKFQIIPSQQQQSAEHSESNGYQQHYRIQNSLARNNMLLQQQQQQQARAQQQQQHQHQMNLQRYLTNQHNSNNSNSNSNSNQQHVQLTSQTETVVANENNAHEMDAELIDNTINKNNNNNQLTTTTTTTQVNELNVVNNNNNQNNYNYNQQQQGAQAHSSLACTTTTTATATTNCNNQQYYKLQEQREENMSVTTKVEPMCMSPEHHQQQQQQQHPLSLFNVTTTAAVVAAATTTTLAAAGNANTAQFPSQKEQQQQHQQPTTNENCNGNGLALVAGCRHLTETIALANEATTTTATTNDHNNKSNQNEREDNVSLGTFVGANHSHTNDMPSNNNSPMSSELSGNSECGQLQGHNVTLGFDAMELNSNSNSSLNEQQQQQQQQQQQTMSYFNETLELSQEDIQRTLLANMPYNVAESHSNTNNNTNNNNNRNSSSTPRTTDDETNDVFSNLYAFDMLDDLPDLELAPKSEDNSNNNNDDSVELLEHLKHEINTYTAEPEQKLAVAVLQQATENETQQATASASTAAAERKPLTISDICPAWSYPEGGIKVLVIGPWTIDQTYTVLFDAQPVPTVLVQAGVLRCYCPAHEVGLATLQVACGNYVISNAVMFEYKTSLLAEAPFDATTSNDCLYKFTLLNRLSCIEEKMQTHVVDSEQQQFDKLQLFMESHFEEKVVGYCKRLAKRTWHAQSGYNWQSGFRGMSLLHLAGALGFSKLVRAMLNWRSENPHIILETELDALSQDVHGYTPLAWACLRGHTDCAVLLYKWNQNALKIKNNAQQTPFELATLKGHKQLLVQIYRMETERCRKQQTRGSLASLSMHTSSNSSSGRSQLSSDDSDEQLGYYDGVFLRPIAFANNNTQSPPNNSSRYSKRSSIDSGINMDMRSGRTGKPYNKDIGRLHGTFDASHESYAIVNDSPLDNLTSTNSLLSPLRKMDFALCEVSTGDSSPNLLNSDHDGDDSSTLYNDDCSAAMSLNKNKEPFDKVVGDPDAKVLTLAEHIIAAMPEHIKNESDEMMVLGSPLTEPLSAEAAAALSDSFMDPLLDPLSSAPFDSNFSFDFNDHNSYRYHDVSTPCSSLSPASSGPLQSPASYSLLGTDTSVCSPSPPPSTKQLTEFLNASSISSQYPFEADFSKLTLTDTEQRELYEAAKCIQKAYRSYKGRQKMEEQNKERTAAIVIQNYYRRYKQYAYYRQMTNAALVIQHGYRSYCRNKRFKKSQNSDANAYGTGDPSEDGSAASNTSQCLSTYYDHYKQDQQQQLEFGSQPNTPKETSPSGPLKRTYSQSTQNQAARKIQQFMRQSRNKLQKERAEKEKLVHQRRAEYLQNSQLPE